LPIAGLGVVAWAAQRPEVVVGVRVGDARGNKIFAGGRPVVGDGGEAPAEGTPWVRGEVVESALSPCGGVAALGGGEIT
jgi:hypothetical protein